jgi:hypothetical protein
MTPRSPLRVACLSASLLLFFAVTARTRADEWPFGVNEDLVINDPLADVPSLVAAMREAGIQVVRAPFRRYAIEPSRGQFVVSRYDAVVAAVRSAGIDVLGIPSDVPTWANEYSGPWSGTYPPVRDADWANFVYRVAEHYRGQVFAWELWNEENIQQFFRPSPDPVRYVPLG